MNQRASAWQVVLLAFVVSACRAKAGQKCDKQGDCAGDLVCDCEDETEFACRDKAGRRCMTLEQANAICAKSSVCKDDGMCEATPRAGLPSDVIGPGCMATPEICAKSELCRRSGRCVEEERWCVAGSDEDCRRSDQCRELGACARGDKYCTAKSEADCAASARCKSEGKCKLRDGDCVN